MPANQVPDPGQKPATDGNPPNLDPHSPQLYAYVEVTHQWPGFHRWPTAPVERDYLSHRHQHTFMYTVTVQVDDQDRAIEFHDLRDYLVRVIDTLGMGFRPTDPHEWGDKSCEMIAHSLMARLLIDYFGSYDVNRTIQIRVSEDGIHSGIVVYNPFRTFSGVKPTDDGGAITATIYPDHNPRRHR